MTQPVPPAPAARVLGGAALYPLLLAVHPAMALWAANVAEALPGEVWPAVWLPAVVTAVAWAGAAAALRSVARGAIVAGIGAAAVLNAGRASGGDPGAVAILVVVVLLAGAAVLAWRLPTTALAPTTAIANVLAVVLVVLPLPVILAAWGPGQAASASSPPTAGQSGLAGRDIWYIIPDRYPRQDVLADVFGYDNEPFVAGLEAKGFQVADRALANYPKTAHSLAATWNLRPVDELIPDPPADQSDWQPLYRLLRDSDLARLLTDTGYEYLHLGTWWSPTATSVYADRVIRVDTTSEFVSVWRSQTLLPALARADAGDGEDADLSFRELNRRYSSYQLEQMQRLAVQPHDTPRFVLAHVTLPHEPYVFAADGSLVTAEQEASRTREENFVGHMEYLNSELEDLVATLTSGPPETWPVIVIQSDEGPHPAARTGPAYDWTTAPDRVLLEKLATFSAILLPGSDVILPEDLTGVDTWRHVLDATIGTNYGPVDDPPIEVFPGEDHLYTLVDVRDRVR